MTKAFNFTTPFANVNQTSRKTFSQWQKLSILQHHLQMGTGPGGKDNTAFTAAGYNASLQS